MRKVLYLIFALLLALPVVSYAETETRQLQKESLQAQKEQMMGNLQMKRNEVKEKMKTNRDELKGKMEQKREVAREKITEHRDQLKDKLKAVRDERKKQAVERIQDSLTALNERMTNHFSAVLDKIENALERVISRTDKADEAGRDVASARSAIEKAEAAIAAARTAIGNQAGKVYEVTVRAEDSLKADVGASRKGLHADLTTLKRAVQAAHQAVREAATTLARVPRLDAVDSEVENSAAKE